MKQIRRKAILLGSTRGDLNGVNADLAKVKNYLRSPMGGAWLPGEIVTRTEITWYSLQRLLIAAGNVDYLLVYFSGHGFESDGNRLIWINAGEAVQDLSLFNGAPRQLVICDSCRTGAAIGAIPGVARTWADAADFWAARAVFDYYISNSPAGQAIVQMTQSNQEAGETPAGGWGTLALLDAAVSGMVQYPSLPVTLVNQQGILQEWDRMRLEESIAVVTDGLLATYYRQVPEVIPVCGRFDVPFGVYLVSAHGAMPGVNPPRKKMNGFALAGGVLLAACLVDQIRQM